MGSVFLYAHAGHYLWVMYIPPVLVVVFSIVKATISERRAEREEQAGGKEEAQR